MEYMIDYVHVTKSIINSLPTGRQASTENLKTLEDQRPARIHSLWL
jgi:hypothetical protein